MCSQLPEDGCLDPGSQGLYVHGNQGLYVNVVLCSLGYRSLRPLVTYPSLIMVCSPSILELTLIINKQCKPYRVRSIANYRFRREKNNSLPIFFSLMSYVLWCEQLIATIDAALLNTER